MFPHQPFAPQGSPAKPVRFRPPHAGRTAARPLPSRHNPRTRQRAIARACTKSSPDTGIASWSKRMAQNGNHRRWRRRDGDADKKRVAQGPELATHPLCARLLPVSGRNVVLAGSLLGPPLPRACSARGTTPQDCGGEPLRNKKKRGELLRPFSLALAGSVFRFFRLTCRIPRTARCRRSRTWSPSTP